MPVVLDDADALAWLGDTPLPEGRLLTLCRGWPADALMHEIIPAKPKSEAIPPKLTVTRPAKKPAAEEGPMLL